jgi:hypothetical protein
MAASNDTNELLTGYSPQDTSQLAVVEREVDRDVRMANAATPLSEIPGDIMDIEQAKSAITALQFKMGNSQILEMAVEQLNTAESELKNKEDIKKKKADEDAKKAADEEADKAKNDPSASLIIGELLGAAALSAGEGRNEKPFSQIEQIAMLTEFGLSSKSATAAAMAINNYVDSMDKFKVPVEVANVNRIRSGQLPPPSGIPERGPQTDKSATPR